jgi:cell division protein FtsI/penicillin-binding protein 2
MRLNLLKFFYLFLLGLITIRLFYWQVIKAEDMSALAESQHTSEQVIEAPRGEILAADGSVFASNKPTFVLFANPKVMKDKEKVAQFLAKLFVPLQLKNTPSPQEEEVKLATLDLRDGLMTKLSKDLYWVALNRNLDNDIKLEIERMNLTGLGFDQETKRYYPESSSAAHILGFVASDDTGAQKGYFGIEGFYNGELRGIPGELTEERDAQGTPIIMGKFARKEAQKGHDLVLNIDRTVQYIAEKKLKAGMIKYGAKSGSVVIMDPKTGAIMAMAAYPNYDPGNFIEYPKENFKNPLVADSYEPGSTFKVLNMAAAVNEGLVTPETTCDICEKPIQIGEYKINTWNNQYYKDTTMTDVIVHSDNTGMVFIARKLGLDKLYDYIEKFGFGSSTNVDLQDETTPSIRDKNDWKEIDLATASFGQGIAVTGIQMVTAVSTIANGGNLMEPHIVRLIRDGKEEKEIKPKVVRQVISQQAAKIVTEMMVSAVDKGEAKYLKTKGYKVAGKTGTAQIPVAGHYDPTKTNASFVGFAPADDPKFVMLVRYEQPTSSIYGAETAAPTFFEISRELFSYYNIPPSE